MTGTFYGGMGGIDGGREIDSDNPFEIALEAAVGDRVRSDERAAVELWCALANTSWKHAGGDAAAHSFRRAGDVVSAIRRDGSDYLTWYCSGPAGAIVPWIAEAMAARGWHGQPARTDEDYGELTVKGMSA